MKRLDIAVAELGLGLTRSQAKNLIEAGNVRVDGDVIKKASHSVGPEQKIDVTVPPPRKLDLTPQDVGITIIYEDSDLAVLEKPAGVSVHPSETEDKPTVVHGLLAKLESLSSVGGVERPGIVHRIDKGTSGVLVVSKTDAAHLGLSAQFKEHSIDRRYHALVYGVPKAKSGKIETFFGRSPSNRKKMTGKLTSGRQAVTHWKVVETLGGLTLIECKLETGRTHQIRVHLSEMGHPLVGDPLYGDNEKRAKAFAKKDKALADACAALNHQLLHAYHLGFKHPVTGKMLEFDSARPADFERVLELARGE